MPERHGVEAHQIADITAPFVYARLMGTTDDHATGLSPEVTELWAGRARAWAAGDAEVGLEIVAPPPEKAARDVFLYVISGAKPRNPAAAMALIERLADGD